MKDFLVSTAYIYPLCPLSFSHAKMFVVADIIARKERAKGKNVFFPIASHYSGNSAQKISKIFEKKVFKTGYMNDNEKKIFSLYRDFYKTPDFVLKTFNDPLNILNFYNRQILWELKSLQVSCDYQNFYTTTNKDYALFVNTIISFYEKNNLLVKNDAGNLVLDYNNEKWKNKMIDLLDRTVFTQPFHKNNVKSAKKDVRNDWNLFRKDGLGIKYKDWVIDPMFDSEIFIIFDLYIKYTKSQGRPSDVEKFFIDLFSVLQTKNKSKNILINKILKSLPCDVLVCEEHLKNWLVKKLYAESLFFDRDYQTKEYFILGMGFLDGKQMSASKGNGILVKDLIDYFGSNTARLIILLSGGHPSKMYNYDKKLPDQARKILSDFSNHYMHILSVLEKENALGKTPDNKLIEDMSNNIENNIEKAYYRQAVIELFSILPKKYYKSPTLDLALCLHSIYSKYCEILMPGLLNNFNNYEKIHE